LPMTVYLSPSLFAALIAVISSSEVSGYTAISAGPPILKVDSEERSTSLSCFISPSPDTNSEITLHINTLPPYIKFTLLRGGVLLLLYGKAVVGLLTLLDNDTVSKIFLCASGIECLYLNVTEKYSALLDKTASLTAGGSQL